MRLSPQNSLLFAACIGLGGCTQTPPSPATPAAAAAVAPARELVECVAPFDAVAADAAAVKAPGFWGVRVLDRVGALSLELAAVQESADDTPVSLPLCAVAVAIKPRDDRGSKGQDYAAAAGELALWHGDIPPGRWSWGTLDVSVCGKASAAKGIKVQCHRGAEDAAERAEVRRARRADERSAAASNKPELASTLELIKSCKGVDREKTPWLVEVRRLPDNPDAAQLTLSRGAGSALKVVCHGNAGSSVDEAQRKHFRATYTDGTFLEVVLAAKGKQATLSAKCGDTGDLAIKTLTCADGEPANQ